MFLHSCPFCWGNFPFLFPIEYSTYMSLLKSTYVFPARPPVFNQVLSWEPRPQAATVFQARWDCTLLPGEVKNTIIKWQSSFELGFQMWWASSSPSPYWHEFLPDELLLQRCGQQWWSVQCRKKKCQWQEQGPTTLTARKAQGSDLCQTEGCH